MGIRHLGNLGLCSVGMSYNHPPKYHNNIHTIVIKLVVIVCVWCDTFACIHVVKFRNVPYNFCILKTIEIHSN